MRFHVRIAPGRGLHAPATLFANGANCGTLTFRRPELDAFCVLLQVGADVIAPNGEPITVEITREPETTP